MALTTLPPRETTAAPADDYLVETEETTDRPSAAFRVVRFLQAVLIAVLVVLSLAIFWLIGVTAGIL